jgi:hypothetical protein
MTNQPAGMVPVLEESMDQITDDSLNLEEDPCNLSNYLDQNDSFQSTSVHPRSNGFSPTSTTSILTMERMKKCRHENGEIEK